MIASCMIGETGIEVIGKVLKASVKDSKEVANYTTWVSRLKSAYQLQGLKDDMVDWNLIQDFMESGGFTNSGAKKYNNPGNIMWSKHLKYGTKGGYDSANKTYWASFKNLDEYVQEKILVLSQKPGRPIDATSGKDFVHRLKLNNYFGNESEAAYLAALQGANKTMALVPMLQDDQAQDVVAPDAEGWWAGLPWYEKAGVIVGGGVVGLVVIKSALQ